MSQIPFRQKALTRLAVFCLSTSALTMPALAAVFSVGGGTITTTQADASSDSTGTGGPFALQANTIATGDVVTVTGVSITNTSQTPNGRALDVGGLLPSAGSYAVTMHDSTLAGDNGFATGGAGAWFQSAGGLISFDSTGGTANTISGKQGLVVANNTSDGGVSIKTGADTITGSGGEVIYGVGQGTGTVSIDTVGATLTGGSLYGIVAVASNGAITLGALNGGIASTINVAGGTGIITLSGSNHSVTLANSGVINADKGVFLQGLAVTVDSFGTINAATNAVEASLSNSLALNLRSSSSTSGVVLGSPGADTLTLFGGANIAGATFNGNGGSDTLILTGTGGGNFAVTSVSSVEAFQKSGTGTWTLTGTTTNVTPWTISGGTLAISNGGALGASSGSLAFDGGALRATANSTIANDISFSNGSIGTISVAPGQTLTLTGDWTVPSVNDSVAIFGSPTDTGTIVLTPFGVSSNLSLAGAVEVAGGTLQASMFAISGVAKTTVDAGATLDFSGPQLTDGPIYNLLGTGTVITNTTTPLILGQGVFSGAIIGAGKIEVGTLCRGPVVFPGGCFTHTTGVVLFSGASSYSGGTKILGGTIQIENMAALGTGAVTLDVQSKLSAIAGGTFSNDIVLVDGALGIISASSGQTLTLTGSNISLDTSGALIFGTATETGIVVFQPTAVTAGLLTQIEVDGGTLRAGNSQFNTLLSSGFGLFVNSGATVDLNGLPATVNGLLGDGQIQTGGATLSVVDGQTFAGVITGTGAFHQLADAPAVPLPSGGTRAGFTGKTILTSTNTYTGGTIIDAGGILQLGNGGLSGSIVGNVQNNGVLAVNRSGAYIFDGIISGSGTVTTSGFGTLTLSSTSTYTGATTVSAGTLSVTGAIASSSVSVANGATLSGTGQVGTTTIASGGTLAPGNSIGTLAVNGNLTLAPGAIYSAEVSPTVADRTMVGGTASISGSTFTAAFASGSYTVGQRYTVLSATGSLTGTFASVTAAAPSYVRPRISYDANNVYLNLDPNALTPLLSNPTGNQNSVASAIDVAVAAGGTPPAGFTVLYSLSGPALNSALDQISGQVGSNTVNAVGQSSLSFLTMTAQGSSSTGNFAPGSAFGGADAPHRAQLGAGQTRVWASAYGGHVGLSADAASGAASLSSSNVGMIGGADMAVDNGLLLGVTIGLGRQSFSSGNGSGNSDDVMFGVYARKDAGPLYIAGALGYGRHHITTLRVITVSGTDVLQGKQTADDFGGRLEAGWRMPLDEGYSVTPYGALAVQRFESPAYAETTLAGASTFALSYAPQTTTLGRSELGAQLDRGYALDDGILTLGLRAAWAHQLDDQPFTQASFLGLPGAAFQVAGVRPSRDTALLGLDLEIQNSSGLFFGIHGQGQFGAGTTLVQGLGNFGWRW
ncbi:MAG TPA: autotransporter domain-containing protein [Rhizomicrobium sp.]|nr:autotransporter domain-containing protein [Rhizomicrobium sp.]